MTPTITTDENRNVIISVKGKSHHDTHEDVQRLKHCITEVLRDIHLVNCESFIFQTGYTTPPHLALG